MYATGFKFIFLYNKLSYIFPLRTTYAIVFEVLLYERKNNQAVLPATTGSSNVACTMLPSQRLAILS